MRFDGSLYLPISQNHELLVQSATSKDEALKQALAAAEKIMHAVKLTRDPAEKKILNNRFNAAADVARSVKNGTWTPTRTTALFSRGSSTIATGPQISNPRNAAEPSTSYPTGHNRGVDVGVVQHQQLSLRPKSKADGIGAWAADVAEAAHHTSDDPYPQSTSSIPNTSSGTETDAQFISPVGKSLPSTSSSHFPPAQSIHKSADYENARPDHSRSISQSQLDPVLQDDLKARRQQVVQKELPVSDLPTSVSHVRKLREPITSRKRTTKEEIILLKASLVNGVKCPPWDKIPSAEEFACDATGIYTYVYISIP